ncbi:unnamed protein product [Xylocopa violacea]|uniref:Pentatricopeptide repeat-containing protein 2 n=1 Tax=Xylocopa violacea TaxID=135666 RepID=A0ABP1N1P1_XYLVO
MNLRRLCRLNISPANNILFKSNFINVGIRYLYTENDLGITAYENARFLFRNQFMSIENSFRTKMKEVCESNDGIVYTEDLKAMLHLAQQTDDDMEIINNMLIKYVQSKEERRFGSYAFSPVVMRMYYYLNQPQMALAMFENPIFADEFQFRSCYRVLMCLLFKHNMYKEMRSVHDKMYKTQGAEFIGGNIVLIYAACLKENTPETLEYALNYWKELYNVIKHGQRSCSLLSLLAIKHNKSRTALEILSISNRQTSMLVRCLKILAYMHMQRYMQIIPLLKSSVENNNINYRRPHFFADVIYELEEKVSTEDVMERNDLLHLIGEVKKHSLETNTHGFEARSSKIIKVIK